LTSALTRDTISPHLCIDNGLLGRDTVELDGIMTRFPHWIRRRWPTGETFAATRHILERYGVHTVCASARCPNIGECYSNGHATFMLLGTKCTRSCAFCSVDHGSGEPVSADEPARVAQAAAELELRHVVVTSVTRDDLPDGGAGQFARTVMAVRAALPDATVEVLTPDFRGSDDAVRIVVESGPDVFGHNVETVPRLTPRMRSHARYIRSLDVLAYAARRGGRRVVVKSGLMVGLGERYDEVVDVMRDLLMAGCRVMTVGQYLRPSPGQTAVHEFVAPEMFDRYRDEGLRLGFAGVSAGPFVRSSYRARALFETARNGAESRTVPVAH